MIMIMIIIITIIIYVYVDRRYHKNDMTLFEDGILFCIATK